ncbi:hypothetical protein PAEVO_16880 [Paenibacillus sp. GM2FR]|nr:hypothetical protein PAEVO_16880 [Paenibacillus sp. GM2FR]
MVNLAPTEYKKGDSAPMVTGQEQLQQVVQALKEWMKSVQK